MKKLAATIAVLALLMGFLPRPSAGASSLTIAIAPFGFARSPVDLRIDIHIERNAKNRWAAVILNSDDYFSESDFPVPGESAPMHWSFVRSGLREGVYQAYVELHQADGKISFAKSLTLEVL